MTTEDPDDDAFRTERWATGLLILLAVALHAFALLNARPLQSANDRSRWCTVWSLLERGTFQIDEIREESGWDSIDILYDDGHFYSTKPPLLSIVVAGVTWCVERVTGWKLLDQTHQVTAAVLLIVNIVPFALSLVLLSRLLKRVANSAWCRLFVLSAAAVGTLASPFLMTLNNHTVAIVGVVTALYALERVLSDEELPAWAFALCGLGAGWACANELPAAAFGLATFLLAARRSLFKTLCWYAPAAIVPLACFLATNVIATGSWKPSYASFGSPKYNFVIDGVPSYWADPDGVDRNIDSPAIYFLHSTIGHHGIFSLTPLFLLALAGWIWQGSIANAALRTMVRLGAVMSVLVIGFYMTRFDNYNYGGVSCGLRWALWLIPFWLLTIIPMIESMGRYAAGRWLQAGLLTLSMLSAWLPVPNPWQQPWLFKQMEARKWIDYTRKPPELSRKLWSWFASIPEPGAADFDEVWVEFTSTAIDGTILRRRLSSRKVDNDAPALVDIVVSEAAGEAPLQVVRRVRIDREKFEAGQPPADFVREHKGDLASRDRLPADYTFVRGLPLKKEFKGGKIRYVRLPIRTDAFRCQMAAAAVGFPFDDPTHVYRCDTWLCAEFPFGVAQYDIHVTDMSSGSTIRHEHWEVSACHPAVAVQAPPLPIGGLKQ